MSACPNVVNQGAGVIAQLVWASVKIVPCSYACDVLPSDLHVAHRHTSFGAIFRHPLHRGLPDHPFSPQELQPHTDLPLHFLALCPALFFLRYLL